ncbi:MAG: PEGA domain-containing protein [Myxococcales bacterium]|nr:PEGA domain-containing protein [Myxococcales bacterium]MCB9731389.1 PEGA domain-containing protein [Deltaproteobacteria bacterium]
MKRTLLRLCLALVALTAMSAASPVGARAGEKVLGMNVEGDKLSPKDKKDLFQVLQAKLQRYPDITLMNPSSHELIDDMIELECIDLDLSCLARLGVKYGADRIVYAQVDPVKGTKGYTLQVKIADANKATMLRDQSVAVPSMAALAGALEAQIEAVWGKPPEIAPPAADGTLVVDASVPTATIYVGTDYAGTGTATISKPPGKYTVRVAADGFDEQVMEVEVTAGGTVTKSVTLVASVMKAPDDGKKKPDDPSKKKIDDDDDGSDWILWAVIGGVVVAGAATAIALAASSDDGPTRAPVVLSVDPNNAWRDAAVTGARP